MISFETIHVDDILDKAVAICRDRKSFLSVDEVYYRDVLKKPIEVFTRLKNNGWPIDPYKAAEIPTPQLRRYAA